MSRAAGTSMASPGSRKARCMSTTSRALLPGMSLRVDSKVSVRSMTYSALGASSSVRPIQLRTIYSALGSPSAHLELPCPHRKGVGDVADGFDPALVVDDDSDHVEAAGLLAETLRAQVALGELAKLV